MRIRTFVGWTFVFLCLSHTAHSQPIKNAIPDVARPLPLSSVRVTGGPFKRAQDLNADYLLKLEPDRMMAYYRERAGLKPKAPGYTGWDGNGRNLTGHIAGHYLSGVSLMFAATGDSRFKERADYIVLEMKEVQDKNGDGYLGAIEGLREKFAEVSKGNIKSTFFDLNGLWSPWYTLHKIVTQDSRVWIAGLGDEGGSGSWLAAAMKQFGQPHREEIAKYEQFIDRVLWGSLQYNDGPNKYSVRKSLFYYSPPDVPGYKYDSSLDWTTWTSWKKSDAESIGRGYNYPHVIAAYWSMYRLARNHSGLVRNHKWDWYLDQAYETTRFMFSRQPNGRRRVGYVELGLMEGDIILALLEDLKREAWNEKAGVIESLMKERAEHWKREPYPFGSEMAWDSTGQEEVYAWCKYFGYDDKALVSLNSIIGYMPTLPHWGYNGNARRYWDFLYAGKIRRIERQLHHYGSGLNAIPVLSHYRENPTDDYLLRVGYGGTMGALSNIDQEGFASVAFHSFPSTLKWDPYTGDYGPNFFGHSFNVATYVINHPEFGWQSFGGNVTINGHWIDVQPLDSFRKRVYIAPRGLWLTLDAGTFERVSVDRRSNVVRITLSPGDPFTKQARLRVQQPAKVDSVGTYAPRQKFVNERDAFTIPLGRSTTSIELTDKR